MATGKVKRLVTEKGFGFIKGADGKDYFFHRSAVKDDGFGKLLENDEVTFDVKEGPKGARAENVQTNQ
jgi:CspA family cold shock protein